MRLIASALLLSALTFSIEASAATISVSEPIFASNVATGGSGSQIFYLPGFNTALGTLSSASLRVNGLLDPGLSMLPYYGQTSPTMVTLVTRLFLFPIGSPSASNRPVTYTQAIPVVLGTIKGNSFYIDNTYDYLLSNATDFKPFLEVTAQSDILSYVGGTVDNSIFVDIEQTSFTGNATLTYTFAVPEPVMLPIFGLLVLALVTIRAFPRARV